MSSVYAVVGENGEKKSSQAANNQAGARKQAGESTYEAIMRDVRANGGNVAARSASRVSAYHNCIDVCPRYVGLALRAHVTVR